METLISASGPIIHFMALEHINIRMNMPYIKVNGQKDYNMELVIIKT